MNQPNRWSGSLQARASEEDAAGQHQPSASKPKVVVVVLNWNGWEDTVQCLRSLQAVTYPNMDVVVVDNGSGPADVAEIGRWTPRVTLIENHRNLGFSGGNNVAIRRALGDPRTDYVLVLNNDVLVEPDFLDHMIATAVQQDAGMVSPTVLSLSDRTSVDRLGIVISAALLGYDMKRWEGREPFCPSGCCALYHRELLAAVELDGEYFDEDFFAYAEDVDLGMRAVVRGFRGALAPQAVVYHKGSASTHIRSPFSQFHGHRNTIWYIVKSVPTAILVRHLHWIVLGQLLPLVVNAARGRFLFLLRAQLAGLWGIPHMLRKRRAVLGRGRVHTGLVQRRLDPRPFYLFPLRRPRRWLARLLARLLGRAIQQQDADA